MTTSDPFASTPVAPLSPAGTARRDLLRAELTGLVRRRRTVRRVTRTAAVLLFSAGIGWLALREKPAVLPAVPGYEVVANDPSVLQRLSIPERPLAAETFLDDDGLQDWLRRAGLPPGYVRTPERIVLMPEVAEALAEAP